MGYHVKIRKLCEKKEGNFVIHCYRVEGGNYNDKGHFYICINPDLKIINFYHDENLKKYIRTFNFNESQKPIGQLEGVEQKIYTSVLIRVYEALKENRFPQYLDYCA